MGMGLGIGGGGGLKVAAQKQSQPAQTRQVGQQRPRALAQHRERSRPLDSVLRFEELRRTIAGTKVFTGERLQDFMRADPSRAAEMVRGIGGSALSAIATNPRAFEGFSSFIRAAENVERDVHAARGDGGLKSARDLLRAGMMDRQPGGQSAFETDYGKAAQDIYTRAAHFLKDTAWLDRDPPGRSPLTLAAGERAAPAQDVSRSVDRDARDRMLDQMQGNIASGLRSRGGRVIAELMDSRQEGIGLKNGRDVLAASLEEAGFAKWLAAEGRGYPAWLRDPRAEVSRGDQDAVIDFLRDRDRKGQGGLEAPKDLRDRLNAESYTVQYTPFGRSYHQGASPEDFRLADRLDRLSEIARSMNAVEREVGAIKRRDDIPWQRLFPQREGPSQDEFAGFHNVAALGERLKVRKAAFSDIEKARTIDVLREHLARSGHGGELLKTVEQAADRFREKAGGQARYVSGDWAERRADILSRIGQEVEARPDAKARVMIREAMADLSRGYGERDARAIDAGFSALRRGLDELRVASPEQARRLFGGDGPTLGLFAEIEARRRDAVERSRTANDLNMAVNGLKAARDGVSRSVRRIPDEIGEMIARERRAILAHETRVSDLRSKVAEMERQTTGLNRVKNWIRSVTPFVGGTDDGIRQKLAQAKRHLEIAEREADRVAREATDRIGRLKALGREFNELGRGGVTLSSPEGRDYLKRLSDMGVGTPLKAADLAERERRRLADASAAFSRANEVELDLAALPPEEASRRIARARAELKDSLAEVHRAARELADRIEDDLRADMNARADLNLAFGEEGFDFDAEWAA
ncbi:hypothetical protein [Azospirillum sp. TSO5]|uniref:hypothetical protein n=1 Tax=Azospirillum sp. TSO5 TaxID=716760 RepID=UPI0011B29242|nr:hypothetical protein [Azospirillum sp. TSO5]